MPKSKKGAIQSKDGQTGSGSKSKGMLFTLFTFFIVILIIGIVFGGAFYLVIHNNINGLGERYRKTIQGIPIARLALPAPADPLDPRYLTDEEIKEKYKEFKKLNEELNKLLAESEKKQEELQKYKDEYDRYKAENDKFAQQLAERAASLDEERLKLNDLKKTIDELIANSDKTGLKEYFETVNPVLAEQIYADVVKQQQIDENAKKFAQIYEAMDASAAAQIFEEMGNSKIDLIAETLKNMKKEKSAEILAAMTPAFASKLTEKLDEIYKAMNQ
ncbi:MAG: DUF615 domain-containing protein [Ruminiclostridium sp.]|nr:DUF615 domain-containing protein [Ruminiclostridium sp.]